MKKAKYHCDLKSCFLCKNSLKEWAPALEANVSTLQFGKNEIIFNENEPVKGVYFINKGTVKVHKQWGDTKELIIRFAKDGDIVGHRGLGTSLTYPISATTLTPATICFINLDFFYATIKINQELLFKLMLFFADELQESERRMRYLAHMPVKGRAAQTILSLKNKFGTDKESFIDITISKQDIASYVGATYETVFKVLNEFEESKLIEIKGKRISLLKSNELKSIASQL
jgi:CRP-like cAMP-binding protein